LAKGNSLNSKTGIASRDACGIVMPISETQSHGKAHWESVLELVKRAIRKSDLDPQEVWTGSSTDRITTRILTNLFAAPIVICDITDLNANVMLELGMRLSSKKPTIVIAELGAQIPFDIKDFEVLEYPPNLSMLPMETFIEDLASQLVQKLQAYRNECYTPFMAGIATFEVLELKAREVPFEQLVAGRLDSILAKIEGIEGSQRSHTQSAIRPQQKSTVYVVVPAEHATEATEKLDELEFQAEVQRIGELGGRVAFSVTETCPTLEPSAAQLAREIAEALGGSYGLPKEFQDLRARLDRERRLRKHTFNALSGAARYLG